MKVVTCASCGMNFDGTNMRAGSQFQCSNCGAMVKVPGVAKATGPQKGPAAARRPGTGRVPQAGPYAAGGPVGNRRPTRGGTSPAQAMAQRSEGPTYGPPKSGGNTGLIVGGIIGGVLLILIIFIVVNAGKPSPQEIQRQLAADQAAERERQARERDEEVRRHNEALEVVLNAALERGPSIENALRNEDRGSLEAMFDWDLFAAHNTNLAAGNSQFLNSPLLAEGQWEKEPDGRFTGRYIGTSPRGANSLRQRSMDYVQEFIFGGNNIRWDRARSEHPESAFSGLEIRGVEYVGRRIFIDAEGAGQTKEFWVGAPRGDGNVRIVNFRDGSLLRNLQRIEAHNERAPATEDPRLDPDAHRRDPYRDREDRPDGERLPEQPPESPDEETRPDHEHAENEDDDLPAYAKTGARPGSPALANCVDDLMRLGRLNENRRNQIRQEARASEKKAVMGAFIDLLIDAVDRGDRAAKHHIANELWTIWRTFVPTDWKREEMTYDIAFTGAQSADQKVVRRWLWVYNSYQAG